ncbi:ROK family transcriptional regulator [Myceligenerans pegani]|uniref:ROK family transcriptional regulator n=1 Tax=Myceligenerans pegani TaxID=2776917 RepID=A0ABR9MXH2_9MICO|nr:ROK family transcriptional regulator [Myceligenerans sp. TRM 65318]MBE1876077.1 ROK family transcriptional regulator [Myceligenerans sp. TRM 65318]MBE3018348.1 ROK family transcriptional regulator [Myceligenerans sp. TRM 65318]
MTTPRRTSRDIRSESRLDVLHAVLVAGETTRNEVTRVTGLSPSTVATVVGELITEGIVAETKRTAGRVGRPTATLTMNAARGRVVGIDVAETYVRAVLFDAALHQVASVEEPRDEHVLDPGTVLDGIAGALDHVLEQGGVTRDDVLGVGISLPGLVRGTSGTSVVVPHWTWHRVELERLRERVGLPLIVDNPLKVMATAELWLGRGRYCSSMVTINLGTGVGAGIVLEGRILRGATNSAGEWGHSLLVLDGRECRCGRHGCVEAYVGAPGIQQTLREIQPAHPLADLAMQRDVIEAMAEAAARPGADPAVERTIERTAYYLGSALADLVAVINPEVVTLTGWTTWALGEHLLPATRARLVDQAPGRSADDVRLEVSTVRGNMVATGVAAIALERFLTDVGLLTTRIPITL